MTQPNQNPSTVRLLLVTVVLGVLGSPAAFAAKTISQFGITWTFDRDYPSGQFANGDPWVVGPVKIVAISPKSTTSGGVTMHGSMINPIPQQSHGFDSRIRNNPFDASKNVARSFPFTVPAGSSLLSAKSYTTKASGNNPQLETIAILTVLAKAPAPGSFRPPYAGTDKTIRWNKSQLDYTKLRSVAPVANTPSLAVVEALFEKPFIDIRNSYASTYLQPKTNHPAYGREISHQVAAGLLSLQLNYTKAQKEKLLVRMVQRGIDIYGLALNGGRWNNDGGHRHGRKPVLLLAGTVLNDAGMMSWVDAKRHFVFQEDQQTWYVSLEDVGRELKSSDGRYRAPYTLAMVGTPEWGGRHTGEPEGDASNWDCHYRNVCGASTVGTVLAARMMGLESKWNWPALFDYIDRYYRIEAPYAGTPSNQIQPFVKAMWQAYRNGSSNFTPDNTSADSEWQDTGFPAQSGSFTCSFDMVASQAKMEGLTGLSTGNADSVTDLAATVRFAPTGFIDASNGATFQAASTLAYTAGVKYRVVISADLATDKYSVTVTPQGGSSVKIASGYSLRTEQKSVTSLDAVSFVSKTGAHSVMNVSASSNTTAPAPTTPTASGTSVLRINAGGKAYTDRSGKVWSADSGFDSGLVASSTSAIAGTEDDKLFQSNRYDNTSSSALLNYRFPLANGTYRVRFLFAETYHTTAGKRRFDVKAEGRIAIDNLDIHARAGGKRALAIEVPVTIADGALNVQFVPDLGNPQVNAIEVIKL